MFRKLWIVFVLGLTATPALAQKGAGVREEIKEKIRAMRIARLITVMNLDESETARLTPILDRTYDQIGAIGRDSGQIRRELRQLINAQQRDDGRMNGLIDRLVANKAKIEELENQMIGEVRKVLTPTQVARMVVVLPEINHEIQQQIRNAVRPGAPGDPF
jgi:hypothetical protein